MRVSKHVCNTLAIIETLHIVVLTNVIQSTGCRCDKFSNRYWLGGKKKRRKRKSFLLFELGGSSCIHSVS